MRTPFPFDHLTLAEVAECERIAARERRGWQDSERLRELLRKRHRPLYNDDGPRAA